MELDEQIARDRELGGTAAPHPEEMRAQVQLRIGQRTVLTATARATPAGLATAGVLVAAVLLSAAVLVRTSRTTRRL